MSLFRAGLLLVLGLSLAGCGGDMLGNIERKIENPFSKPEDKLPGERVAVITDTNTLVIDPAEAGRPVQLPSPRANGSDRKSVV